MKTPEQLRELADRLRKSFGINRIGPCEEAADVFDSIASALEAVGVEPPVAWQFRWTNPGDNPSVSPDELAWKPVETRSGQSLETCIAELEGYRYGKKPCYEVRALYGPEVLARLAEALRQRDELTALCEEVISLFTRDDDLPGNLLERIEDALKEISDGK